MPLPLPKKIWLQLLGPSDPVERAELLNEKLREREINELEAILMLTPENDAPDQPAMWNIATQNAFFRGMAWGIGVTMYFVVYATGLLHV